MKHIFTFLICLGGLTIPVAAQSKIKASDIIKQINEGHDVSYSNVEIEGNLDFTNLANRTSRHSSGNWFKQDDTFIGTVKVSLSFTGCIFSGDVLAYYHLRRDEQTFLANFEKNVVFKNCTFKRASEFKYSEFAETVSFSGSTFSEVANFKYAEFANGPLFADAKFEGGADFKYTEFPRETSFQKATFYDLANFKYSKFKSPLNMEGVAFKGSEDFKYTRIDGRSFRWEE